MTQKTAKEPGSASKTTREQTPTKEDQLTPALEQQAGEIKKLLNRAEASNIDARYEIGEIVVGVMNDKKKYGNDGVERIEKRLGINDKTLYRYAAVVQTFTRPEFGIWREKQTAGGLKLSWSHFVAIAYARLGDKACTRLLELAIAEGLSVREFQARVADAKRQKGGGAAKSNAPKDPFCQLREEAKEVAGEVSRIESFRATVLPTLRQSPSSAPQAQDQVIAALNEYRRLQRVAGEVIAEIESWTKAPLAKPSIAPKRLAALEDLPPVPSKNFEVLPAEDEWELDGGEAPQAVGEAELDGDELLPADDGDQVAAR